MISVVSIHLVTVMCFHYSNACAIPQEDSMILTGGFYTLNTVSIYNAEGWQRDLPPLNTGRRNHACSSYWSGERNEIMTAIRDRC